MRLFSYSYQITWFWQSTRNVDRLFAIWQALNPNSYTINKRSNQDDGGTFSIKQGTLELATTGLAPFYNKTGTKLWDSQGVRQTSTFNYAYPETQSWKFESTTQYQSSVRSDVQQLYGGDASQFVAEDVVSPSREKVGLKKVVKQVLQKPLAQLSATVKSPAEPHAELLNDKDAAPKLVKNGKAKPQIVARSISSDTDDCTFPDVNFFVDCLHSN